jgi:hypothetical protein
LSRAANTQDVDRLRRCRTAGAVGVETHEHVGADLAQLTRLLGGEGGPQRRDRVGESGLMERDAVEIALDDNDRIDLAGRPSRGVERVQKAALGINRRRRGVQIFWLLVAQRPAAKRDHLAGRRVRRNHHASAIHVIIAAVVSGFEQTRLDRGRKIDGIRLELAQQTVPTLGCVPELEEIDARPPEAAALAIIAGRLTRRFTREHPVKVLRGDGVRGVDRLLLVARARRDRVFGFELDAGTFGEPAQRLGKRQIFSPAQIVDDVAMRIAAETLEESLIGVNVKRWRLFRVERTQADEAGPATAQRDELSDILSDIRPRQDLAFDRIVDAHTRWFRRHTANDFGRPVASAASLDEPPQGA